MIDFAPHIVGSRVAPKMIPVFYLTARKTFCGMKSGEGDGQIMGSRNVLMFY